MVRESRADRVVEMPPNRGSATSTPGILRLRSTSTYKHPPCVSAEHLQPAQVGIVDLYDQCPDEACIQPAPLQSQGAHIHGLQGRLYAEMKALWNGVRFRSPHSKSTSADVQYSRNALKHEDSTRQWTYLA